MSIHPDLQKWHEKSGGSSQLTIGSHVKLSEKHPLNEKFQGSFFVVGMEINLLDHIEISISKSRNPGVGGCFDGLSIDDLDAVYPSTTFAA